MYLVVFICSKENDIGGKQIYNKLWPKNRGIGKFVNKTSNRKLLESWPASEYLAQYKKPLADFSEGSFEDIIVSEKAKIFLEGFFVNRPLRFFPVNIYYLKSGEIISNPYYLLNYPCTIACIDPTRSEQSVQSTMKNYCLMNRIVLREGMNDDMMWDELYGGMFVSQRFVDEYHNNDLSGMLFVDIDTVTNPAAYAATLAADRILEEKGFGQRFKTDSLT